MVNIRTESVKRRPSLFNDPFFDEFMGYGGTYTSQSLGTGVLIDQSGTIVTNYHVVQDASDIMVITKDGEQLRASYVGGDSLLDIAVLRVNSKTAFTCANIGISSDIMPGETVIAIGNPYGLESSITTGVVSNPRRILKVDDLFAVFIQTDALINPGNSGGPLINLDGEVIGINTAIYKDAQGIGFAIPIDTVKRIVPEIIKYGKVRRGYPGFTYYTVNKDGGQRLVVEDVTPGSDAARLGVRKGDAIVSLDSIPVGSVASFKYIMRTFPPDEKIEIAFNRGGSGFAYALRLSEYPAGYGTAVLSSRYGVVLSMTGGKFMVRSTKYPQYIHEGDLLYAVNGVEIKNTGDLDAVMADYAYEELRLRFVNNRNSYDVRIKPYAP